LKQTLGALTEPVVEDPILIDCTGAVGSCQGHLLLLKKVCKQKGGKGTPILPPGFVCSGWTIRIPLRKFWSALTAGSSCLRQAGPSLPTAGKRRRAAEEGVEVRGES
jgi:hypothetical protein